MHPLIISTFLVAIAEIGDKTQLLSLLLAARFRCFWPLLAGIAVATTLNHALSAWVGNALGEQFAASPALHIVASLLFIAIGLWALTPDRMENEPGWLTRYGAFTASFAAFFIAEIGDKTQLATITLAAHYQDFFMVTLGTTAGMLLANIPALLIGEKLLARLPMAHIRALAAVAFIGFGLIGLFQTMRFWP